MSDLDKLIEAVEGGNDCGNAAALINNRIASGYHDKGGYWPAHGVMKAYDGSLDAAKALHEALLPGWIWERRGPEMVVQHWDDEFSHKDPSNPARAWLLAILKAYKSQQEAEQ